jgi:hypothetical protein
METKLAAIEAQARQDASMLTRIRKERDDLCLTAGWLRSERETAREECDVSWHQVVTLQAELGEEQNRKLEAKATMAELSSDLGQARVRL